MTSIIKNFPSWPAVDRIHAFVTERTGGFSTGRFESLNLAHHVNDDFSAVERNRDLLKSSVSADLTFQWMDQIHSDIVNVVSVPSPPMKGDSLICREPGIACCVLTADCLPVFLTNLTGTEIAIIHAGWRGICRGILSKTINKMCSEPNELMAWLGPAIGPCHYEVGDDLKIAFKKSIGSEMLAHLPIQWKKLANIENFSSIERLSLKPFNVLACSGKANLPSLSFAVAKSLAIIAIILFLPN